MTWNVLLEWSPWLLSLAHLAAASVVTVDAVLRKRHVQSVFGWVGLAWLAPFVGAAAYLVFGINRIRRSARALHLPHQQPPDAGMAAFELQQPAGALPRPRAPAGLARLGERITGKHLTTGNCIVPLVNGDAAFPQMLDAIASARRSISLQTYIFDSDEVGELFRDALVRAHRRGVAVRVLVDDIGARYARDPMVRRLQQAGVPATTFLPTRLPRLFRYANLRNHRKILVVDGRLGFTGGMNLRAGHWLERSPKRPVRCLHFRIEGPVVQDMQRTFAADWSFASGERLSGEAWFPPPQHCGPVIARGIPDGPDEDLGKLPSLLLGAVSAARHSLHVVTPYFLPDDVLLRSLQIAAMRGIEVVLVLPEVSNIPLIDWAMRPQFRYLLKQGCRIHLSPPPFDHTKLFVVDRCWSLIGSTNWDARSLRLNFEYNVECYDRALADALIGMVEARVVQARQLDPQSASGNVFIRLRNGLARLASPYL
jgi:cardiolipin synthase A/B